MLYFYGQQASDEAFSQRTGCCQLYDSFAPRHSMSVQGVWSEVYGLPLGTAAVAAAGDGSNSSAEQGDQQQ